MGQNFEAKTQVETAISFQGMTTLYISAISYFVNQNLVAASPFPSSLLCFSLNWEI